MRILDNFKPVAKSSENDWLLIPVGEVLKKNEERPIFYYFSIRHNELDPKPLPLQVWCKFGHYNWLTKRDLIMWEKLTKEL